MQQRLHLAVKAADIREDRPWRQPRMGLGERSPSFIDMPDRLIAGVARSDPGREADGIMLRQERRLAP
jgi:hypothetical protein